MKDADKEFDLRIKLFSDFYTSFHNEIESFSNFHDLSEEHWEKETKELDKTMDDDSRGLEELSQIRYESIHRGSLVILIFGFFEYQLTELCKILAKDLENKDDFKQDLDKKFRGGFEKPWEYLKTLQLINMKGISQDVKYIRHVNCLRNNIVHNSSWLPSKDHLKVNKDKMLYKFIETNPHLYFNAKNEDKISYYIESNFITELIERLKHFLLFIWEELNSNLSSNCKS